MRVFVAGATGVVGRQLLPLLVSTGHEVYATTRSEAKVAALREQGVRPVVLDLLDAGHTKAAVVAAEPEVMVHQATALSGLTNNVRRIGRQFAMTNRLRTVGTENLLAAGRIVGIRRFVAQSFAGWPYAPTGGPVKDESDPLDPDPPEALRETLSAIRRLEQLVGDAPGGVTLRYGGLYGPHTSLDSDGQQIVAIRNRQFPSSAMPAASGRSCTSGTRPRPPWLRSPKEQESTTSLTMSRLRFGIGCRIWRTGSAPVPRVMSRRGWRAWSAGMSPCI
jgi:nucleoside-diphosphate-sugar epimerase